MVRFCAAVAYIFVDKYMHAVEYYQQAHKSDQPALRLSACKVFCTGHRRGKTSMKTQQKLAEKEPKTMPSFCQPSQSPWMTKAVIKYKGHQVKVRICVQNLCRKPNNALCDLMINIQNIRCPTREEPNSSAAPKILL